MKEMQTQSYSDLVANIGQTLKEGRSTALRAVNTSLVATNWKIGQQNPDTVWTIELESLCGNIKS